MSKYMFHANYTQGGLGGLLKEGGTRRREALTQTIEGVGGGVEAFYSLSAIRISTSLPISPTMPRPRPFP